MSERSPFIWLLRAHDHLWRLRIWPLEIRAEASRLLWSLASQIGTNVETASGKDHPE